ncbi:MAG: pilus assembly protein, partial [Actinomycetota bacterium]|nr:pilus assembly protein [Actinomycetota bacterium]
MGGMLRRDEGAAAIIVAVCLTVFIGLSALVIDIGLWYNFRRQLQTAADSAALAGCQELILDKTDAEIWDTVGNLAHSNESGPVASCDVIPPSAGGLSDITEDSVKVTVSMEAQSFFGRLLGVNSNLIRAQSRAQVGYLAGAKTPVPWALPS